MYSGGRIVEATRQPAPWPTRRPPVHVMSKSRRNTGWRTSTPSRNTWFKPIPAISPASLSVEKTSRSSSYSTTSSQPRKPPAPTAPFAYVSAARRCWSIPNFKPPTAPMSPCRDAWPAISGAPLNAMACRFFPASSTCVPMRGERIQGTIFRNVPVTGFWLNTR